MPSLPREGVAAGSRLGSACLLAAVGNGSAGRMWAAKTDDGGLVAVKTLLSHLSDMSDVKHAFDELMERLAGIRDPHLCAVLASGIEDDVLFVTSEWVEGETAHRVLGADEVPRPLDPIAAARIVADACQGVHTLHEATRRRDGRALIHTDVTTRNLLVGTDGRTRVSDLGVSAALALASVSTDAAAPLAPEVFEGKDLDERTDVFGLGTVLYELSTGAHPASGLPPGSAYGAVAKNGWPPPSRYVAAYPSELEAIVLAAIAYDRDGRQPSAAALRDALEGWLATTVSTTAGVAEVAALLRSRVGNRIETRQSRIRSAASALAEKESGRFGGPTSGLRPVPAEIDLLNPPIPGPALVPVVPMPRSKPSGAPSKSGRTMPDKHRFALGVIVGFLLFLSVALSVFFLARSFGVGPSPESASHPAHPALP